MSRYFLFQVRTIRINCTARTTNYGDSIYEIGFFGNDPQGEVVPLLSNLKVRDYYRYTGKYMIYFTEAAESVGYNVYIDDKENKVKTIKESGYYLTAQDVESIARGEHDIAVKAVGAEGQETKETTAKIIIEDAAVDYNDIPQIYISTGGKDISGTYFAKQPGGKAM